MGTLATTAFRDSELGVELDLPHVGSALENPYVFDATARELKAMAADGLIEVIDEHLNEEAAEPIIDRLRFVRLR